MANPGKLIGYKWQISRLASFYEANHFCTLSELQFLSSPAPKLLALLVPMAQVEYARSQMLLKRQ
jgi:hypothetical protein